VTNYDYTLFGLTIRSELELRGVAPARIGGEPDVSVTIGQVAAEGDAPGYRLHDADALLTVPDVARFRIRDGKEIVVSPLPGASDRNLLLFLLGSGFGALLHQRGMMPLHANAIDLGGRAVAFCGPSGAGKSTLAAWFSDRGYRLLSDDVCVIGFDPAGRAIAKPGLERLRLWRDALDASGRDSGDYERSIDGRDKYDVPVLREEPATIPVRLAAVYQLDRASEQDQQGRIARLRGAEAVEMLVANTYRGGFLQVIGRTGPHLMTCARIAQSVPLWRAERLWGVSSFDQQARDLEAHALALQIP
jgi:hypothetical protein